MYNITVCTIFNATEQNALNVKQSKNIKSHLIHYNEHERDNNKFNEENISSEKHTSPLCIPYDAIYHR